MDVLLICLILCSLLYLGKTYENIALNKPAWQKHPYLKKPWGAGLAVDGRFSNLSQEGGQCAISQNEPTAEWRVDLMEVLSIHHISIQYMTEQKQWGPDNKLSSVLLGFSVYISNTSQKEEGVLCFKDTIHTAATIPNPVLLMCPYHGRYVFFYNERINPPYPADYSNHSANDLCEVQVYGCPYKGVYGENCSIACPQNCQDNRCNIADGTCLGCIVGYRGQRCEEECRNNTYGPQCTEVCGKCRNNEQCNNVDGTCPSGCQWGKQGVKCDKASNSAAIPLLSMDNPLSVALVITLAVCVASIAINIVLCIRVRKIRRSKAICQQRRLVADTTTARAAENNTYAPASNAGEYVELDDVQKNCHYDTLH